MKLHYIYSTINSAVLFILVLTGCSESENNSILNDEELGGYSYSIPEQTDDGWETASLSSVNLATDLVEEMVAAASAGDFGELHSVVIAKNGKLVFEEYFSGHDFYYSDPDFHGRIIEFDRDTPHNTHSATKSIMSILTGIAVDKGYLSSERDRIFNYLPDYSKYNNRGRENIRIEHLLTMTSGLEWNEWDVNISNSQHDIVQFNLSDDPIEYLLSKPIVTEPGSSFYYNGGAVDLLGEVVKNVSNSSLITFSEQYLFGPMGITDYEWQVLPSGLVVAHGDIYLRPRDLAKIGQLMLNKGKWDGNQVLSEEWVNKSIQEHLPLRLGWADGYGYLWWFRDYTVNADVYTAIKAMGWGGQEIYIFPDLDMVLVFTGANYTTDPRCDFITDRYILRSLK